MRSALLWKCPECRSVYTDEELTYRGEGRHAEAGAGEPAWCIGPHDGRVT